jgi:hypothetical protein
VNVIVTAAVPPPVVSPTPTPPVILVANIDSVIDVLPGPSVTPVGPISPTGPLLPV